MWNLPSAPLLSLEWAEQPQPILHSAKLYFCRALPMGKTHGDIPDYRTTLKKSVPRLNPWWWHTSQRQSWGLNSWILGLRSHRKIMGYLQSGPLPRLAAWPLNHPFWLQKLLNGFWNTSYLHFVFLFWNQFVNSLAVCTVSCDRENT